MGSERAGSRRARVLGLVAAGLAALAIVLLTLGVIGQLTTATPHMRGFNAGQAVTVTERGMSVYSRQDAVREQAVCRATAEDGTSYTFERPVQTFPVDVSGTPFYEVARSPESMEAGRYALACEGTDQAVYAGPRADRTVAPGLVGTAGLVSGGVLLLVAAGLAVVALLLARGTRERPASGQVAPMGHYPYGPPERHHPLGSGYDPYAPPPQHGGGGASPSWPAGGPGPGGYDPYAPPPQHEHGSHQAGPPPAQPPPLSELPPPTGRPYGSPPVTGEPPGERGHAPGGDEEGQDRTRDDGDGEQDGREDGRSPRPWTW